MNEPVWRAGVLDPHNDATFEGTGFLGHTKTHKTHTITSFGDPLKEVYSQDNFWPKKGGNLKFKLNTGWVHLSEVFFLVGFTPPKAGCGFLMVDIF